MDAYHYHLGLPPLEEHHFLVTEDWDEESNIPLEVFAPLITDVPELDFNRDLAVVESEAELERMVQAGWFKPENYIRVLIGQVDAAMQTEISRIIKHEHLQDLARVDIIAQTGDMKYYCVGFGEPVIKKGIYYQKVGFQRRRLTNAFYDAFQTKSFYGYQTDFELAYTFLDTSLHLPYWNETDVRNMQEEFKKQFLDNYVFGRSLMGVSL